MTLPTLDTHDFTRRGDVAEGHAPIASFERLSSLLLDPGGELRWRVAGRGEVGADGSRRSYLRLDVAAAPTMRCVRCLEPIAVALDVGRDYRLVATEAQAEREDAEEDDFDVLVGSRRFELGELVEDEAIMALPPAPRHEHCSAPAATTMGDDDGGDASATARDNPFAVLRGLRGDAARAGGDGGDPDAAPDDLGADTGDGRDPPRRR